jgi:hypothetical protein
VARVKSLVSIAQEAARDYAAMYGSIAQGYDLKMGHTALVLHGMVSISLSDYKTSSLLKNNKMNSFLDCLPHTRTMKRLFT